MLLVEQCWARTLFFPSLLPSLSPLSVVPVASARLCALAHTLLAQSGGKPSTRALTLSAFQVYAGVSPAPKNWPSSRQVDSLWLQRCGNLPPPTPLCISILWQSPQHHRRLPVPFLPWTADLLFVAARIHIYHSVPTASSYIISCSQIDHPPASTVTVSCP